MMNSENDKTVQRYIQFWEDKFPGFSGHADAETYNRLFNKIEEEERDFYRSKRGMTESRMVDKVQKIIEDFLR